MLSHLYIRDFTLVQDLELALGGGLTVLTGETGAGKSVLIDALAAVLGERADASSIRDGADRAEIAAMFDLNPEQDAALWLREQDLFGDGECVVRRVIERDKPSRGFINGRPVAMQMLRELGEKLVDIHGQHEHQSLLKREAQRQILDDFAGLGEALAVLGNHYAELKSLESRLEELTRQSADRDRRLDLLRYQVQELEALDLQPGEIPQLEEEHRRLSNGEELLSGVQAAAGALYEDDEASATQLLTRVVNRLEALTRHDARLAEPVSLLRGAVIGVDEAAAWLRRYAEDLDLDPQRLQWIDDRLAAAHALARKHQVRPEELTEVLGRLRVELNGIEDIDANLDKLQEGIERARAAYLDAAAAVSKKRNNAAGKLGQQVTARMQELGMPGGRFEAGLTPLEDGAISAHGLERIEFLVSANPGQDVKPLNKVASGGELSRISLALQVTAAGAGRIPSLIFDEVDVGIGGRVAEIVGQQLRVLGGSRQVLCITHLAQVAALGGRHLQANKVTGNSGTRIQVRPLTDAERVEEIARMIGGVKISRQTLAHAEDMLSRASVV